MRPRSLRMDKAQADASLEATHRHLNRKSTDLAASDERIKVLEVRSPIQPVPRRIAVDRVVLFSEPRVGFAGLVRQAKRGHLETARQRQLAGSRQERAAIGSRRQDGPHPRDGGSDRRAGEGEDRVETDDQQPGSEFVDSQN